MFDNKNNTSPVIDALTSFLQNCEQEEEERNKYALEKLKEATDAMCCDV